MEPSLEFTAAHGALFQSHDGRSCPYKVPQHLLPKKVHSCTGTVISAETLLEPNSLPYAKSTGDHCTIQHTECESTYSSLILDFGVAVAGIPVIHVPSVESNTFPLILDFSFSEGYPGILRDDGDGPFPFSAGADTMRRVRFRINHPGYHEAKYVQGSQRWGKITLVSYGSCSIALSMVAFKPTTINIPLNELPGFFECSDSDLTELWGYGARTLQLNSIPARTIPPSWQVSEDMGILIDSQRCNAYGWGGEWTDYEVTFDAMIIHGGLSWNVRVNGGGLGFVFVISLPVNKEDNPTLELWYGYFNKPQITLVPILLARKQVISDRIIQGRWLSVITVCIGEEINVYLDGNGIDQVSQANDTVAASLHLNINPEGDVPKTLKGSVGLGAGQDQVCRFKNLKVVALPSMRLLYSSGLNTPAVLGDFGIGWNQLPYIFDGAKRDRYAWTADIITGGLALYYSTAGTEFVRGNIEASMLRSKARRDNPALLPGGVPPGREFERDPEDTMFNVLTVNYSLYLIIVLYDYWIYTDDEAFVALYWDRIVGCLDYVEARVNSHGLIEVQGMDAGDYDYYNGFQTGVSTKRNALYVATLRRCAVMARSSRINDKLLAETFVRNANRTIQAINQHLYSSQLGHYWITTDRQEGFQQELHAWLLNEDIPPHALHSCLLSKFDTLCSSETYSSSPLSFSPDTPNITPVVSPIMSAFHILALLHKGEYARAAQILRSVWSPMYDKTSPHFTGTTWEFLTPTGEPFKDHFCSYAQLFSVGPTAVLSRFVLGVEPLQPGYKDFLVSPRWDLNNIMWAQGRVPTPMGQPIVVRWQMFEQGWRLWCKAPQALKGKVVVPRSILERRKRIMVNLKEGIINEGEFTMGPNSEFGSELDLRIYFI